MPLQPKTFDLLVVLVTNPNRLLTKEALLDEVWSGATVEEGNLSQNVYFLRKALGDSPTSPRYIETVPRSGYRFIADVREVARELPEPPAPEPDGVVERLTPDWAGDAPSRPPGGALAPRGWSLGHAALACSLYALLYVIALFVEVAYQFDRLGPVAWRLAPWVFVWILATSGVALWADWRLTRSGRTTGMVCSVPAFVLAGFALVPALAPFLPHEPVTEATVHAYPALGAYLKSCYYFVPLAVVYLVLPFHFVAALEQEVRAGRGPAVVRLLEGRRAGRAPRGAVYLRVWWLGLLLVVLAGVAIVGVAWLFERLVQDRYSGLFMTSVQLRVLVYFLLGSECLIWYYLALNDIKHRASARGYTEHGTAAR